MCSNSRTMKKQKTKSTKTKNPSQKSTFSTNPSRKTRTKTRKHKFLSLKTELSSSKPNSPTSDQVSPENHPQLNLFPLHPGNLFEERETHYDNVDYFFDSDGGATTLNGFVWGGEGGAGEGSVGLGSDHEDSLSPSLTYTYQGQDSEEGGGDESSLLVRNALRHKQRDESEEKWICYEEVLVEKKEQENSRCREEYQNLMHGLCLKLDYQEIMNAWSDKGPLYIGGGGGGGDSSQIVPDVLDDPYAHDSTNQVYIDGGNVPQWKVPGGDGNGATEAIDGGEGSLMLKEGERKARVLRYKEKRQSRLFSKRIRYEVRKLNAEKRPRMKGRFVKRD